MYDTVIHPQEFSNDDLLWMSAMWANVELPPDEQPPVHSRGHFERASLLKTFGQRLNCFGTNFVHAFLHKNMYSYLCCSRIVTLPCQFSREQQRAGVFMTSLRSVTWGLAENPGVSSYCFLKLPPYTPAGFDLTTHSSNLLGGRRRQYHKTTPPGRKNEFLKYTYLGHVRRRLVYIVSVR
jgi:hypothetical protein